MFFSNIFRPLETLDVGQNDPFVKFTKFNLVKIFRTKLDLRSPLMHSVYAKR